MTTVSPMQQLKQAFVEAIAKPLADHEARLQALEVKSPKLKVKKAASKTKKKATNNSVKKKVVASPALLNRFTLRLENLTRALHSYMDTRTEAYQKVFSVDKLDDVYAVFEKFYENMNEFNLYSFETAPSFKVILQDSLSDFIDHVADRYFQKLNADQAEPSAKSQALNFIHSAVTQTKLLPVSNEQMQTNEVKEAKVLLKKYLRDPNMQEGRITLKNYLSNPLMQSVLTSLIFNKAERQAGDDQANMNLEKFKNDLGRDFLLIKDLLIETDIPGPLASAISLNKTSSLQPKVLNNFDELLESLRMFNDYLGDEDSFSCYLKNGLGGDYHQSEIYQLYNSAAEQVIVKLKERAVSDYQKSLREDGVEAAEELLLDEVSLLYTLITDKKAELTSLYPNFLDEYKAATKSYPLSTQFLTAFIQRASSLHESRTEPLAEKQKKKAMTAFEQVDENLEKIIIRFLFEALQPSSKTSIGSSQRLLDFVHSYWAHQSYNKGSN